eukprot:2372504-Alexandrium_andersonii.AAC.1
MALAVATASLHRRVPKVQSAIRPMPISAATRLNPQSAMREITKHKNTSRDIRSLSHVGPAKNLKTGPRSSRRVRSAPLFAQIPNLPTKAGLEG